MSSFWPSVTETAKYSRSPGVVPPHLPLVQEGEAVAHEFGIGQLVVVREIFLDGELLPQRTPTTIPEVPAGLHHLELRKPLFRPFTTVPSASTASTPSTRSRVMP